MAYELEHILAPCPSLRIPVTRGNAVLDMMQNPRKIPWLTSGPTLLQVLVVVGLSLRDGLALLSHVVPSGIFWVLRGRDDVDIRRRERKTIEVALSTIERLFGHHFMDPRHPQTHWIAVPKGYTPDVGVRVQSSEQAYWVAPLVPCNPRVVVPEVVVVKVCFLVEVLCRQS